MEDKIYIKFIDKSDLLFELWKNAKTTHYFYDCPEMSYNIDIHKVKQDIQNMINNKKIDVSVYHGKNLYVELSGDYLKSNLYNLLNGKSKAEQIVSELKIRELKKTILKYYLIG